MSLMAMRDGTLRCVLPLLGTCGLCFAHTMLIGHLVEPHSVLDMRLPTLRLSPCLERYITSPISCLHVECGLLKNGCAPAECIEALTVRDLLLRRGVARVQSRIKVRVVCARAYHALFMYNMMIRPTEQELAEFGTPDFTIFNAGAFPVNRYTSYMSSSTSVDVNLRCPASPHACACITSLCMYQTLSPEVYSTHSQAHLRAAGMRAREFAYWI